MVQLSEDSARQLGYRLLEGAGATSYNAQIVTDHLVEASLRGLDSHGVIRLLFYSEQVLEGKLNAKADPNVIQETPVIAVVDGNGGFGQVCARHVADIALDKARKSGMACVISKRAHHIGRLGAYTEQLAREGLIAIGSCCSHQPGHFVAPFGGREGRLATNPISWAGPTSGEPLVLDMSTSMIAEGKIKALQHAGMPLPPGCVLDAQGVPSTDPNDFYGPPRGTILPFGKEMGYKGFGLSVLTMTLGEALAGYVSGDPDWQYLNGLALIAIDPAAFGDQAGFLDRMDGMVKYFKDTPPAEGFDEVLVPGEMEQRIRAQRLEAGIPILDETRQQMLDLAGRLNVELPELAEPVG